MSAIRGLLQTGDTVLIPLSERRGLVRTLHTDGATIYVLPTRADPEPSPVLRCYSFGALVKVERADG